MSDPEKIEAVIAREEDFVRFLTCDVMRHTLAGALRRAGVRDEAAIVANALLTREDTAPLPMLMADGVIAYVKAAVEGGIEVRRAALREATDE